MKEKEIATTDLLLISKGGMHFVQEPATKVETLRIPMTAQWLAFFCRRRQEREKVLAISNCPKGRPKADEFL